jgi:ABC-2 type transport system permease protein
LRAYPTLLRIGFAEAVAYRAELLVWMLATTMPLVSMALWSSAADGLRLGPEQLGSRELIGYFTLTLLVRLLTSSWVLWQLTEDIRTGTMATRLLRPLHPLFIYAAEQLAALPLRCAIVLPASLGLLYFVARHQLTGDPWLLFCFAVALPGAWAIGFLAMSLVGLLAFFIDSATGLFFAWMGLYTLLSGYLVPQSLLPAGLAKLVPLLPFHYMLEAPARMLLGWPLHGGVRDTLAGREQAFIALAVEYGYVVGLLLAVSLVWRAGVRRYAAFGG